jgi:hypothetical protein
MKTHITFVRKDINSIENLVVICFSHKKTLKTPYEVFKAFTTGITKWVENTEEGQTLWNYTSEDLNIGDILNSSGNKTLNKYLAKEGIKKWATIYELIDQEEFSYDKVLAHPVIQQEKN